ncbi:hypothetical protein LTR62_001852 [Meristemomyces frigidus]|uniref:Ribosomal protein L9 domain-containing protein n=1 Tax=Meristemomyces frigidus TaxID=1508187 RepID=A0AAN7T7R2_9PEZI|nr:hypothetical protein LTR62_001852 [Meristemomyces frigidus]
MSMPISTRAIPHCSACVRSYLTAGFGDLTAPPVLRQQVRGKKKLANASSTVPVRLLKDVRTFGRKGSIVPISPGQMRNEWFPRHMAAYVTLAEQKSLRLRNVAFERDFDFGLNTPPPPAAIPSDLLKGAMSRTEQQDASMFQRARVDISRLSPERCTELIGLFVPSRLEFYRQPIIEEKEAEPEPAPEPRKVAARSFGFGAGAELMAARAQQQQDAAAAALLKPKAPIGPQAIYGSVSTQDILVAVRAEMARNDEAKMVVLREEDIKFVDLPADEAGEGDRVKHVGDFAVEIKYRGVEEGKRVVVRVVAQEVAA